MARCDVCGNDYDKPLQVEYAVRGVPTIHSSARFTRSRQLVPGAVVELSGTESNRQRRSIAALIARKRRSPRDRHPRRRVRARVEFL